MSQLSLFADSPTDTEVRSWASANGFDCPRAGRVPDSLRQAFASWSETPHEVLTHTLLPNMSWACGADILDCHCCRTEWHKRPTCPWCRSLGPAWARWATRIMQGLDPITLERRDTDPERRMLAGAA